jgi:phage shock protein A
VARVIAGGAHALLDQLEGVAPLAMLEQSVREVQNISDEVRAELGRVVASRHLAQQQHARLNAEHESLNTALQTALAVKRDDLAAPAIARQLDIEAQLPILETSLANFTKEERELSSYVDALLGKRREMDAAILALSQARAEAQRASPNSPSNSSTIAARLDAVSASFERTYQRAAGIGPGNAATLDQAAKLRELAELTRSNKINERLAQLKATA